MSNGLKGKVARGTFWALLEQFGVQGVNLLMGIVLARLLSPSDYGAVAEVTIFITISSVLVNSGFGQALVQKREIDGLDIDSVFYLSTGIAFVLYAALFFFAPLAAGYYRNPELMPILRVLALNLLLYAVNSVQSAELYRQMKFNLTFRVSMATAITSAVVGVGLALGGYGIWALVWSSLAGSVAGVIARAFVLSWYPRLRFSWGRIRPLFRYGSRMMANSLIGSIMSNLYGPVIGRCYTSADLGLVNKGRNLPDLLLSTVNASLIEVSLPALVQLQDDRERLVRAMRRLMTVSTCVIFPLMFVLAAVAREVTLFLYGEKWLLCVIYMQIVCVLMAFGPIGAVNQQGMLAVGRSGLYLKIGIIRNVLSAIVVFVCLAHMSIQAWVLVNALLFGPISAAIDAVFASRALGYRLRDQLLDFLPGLLTGLLAAAPVFALNCSLSVSSPFALFALLVVECVFAGVAVLGLDVLFRIRGACEMAQLMRERFGGRCGWCEGLFKRMEIEGE